MPSELETPNQTAGQICAPMPRLAAKRTTPKRQRLQVSTSKLAVAVNNPHADRSSGFDNRADANEVRWTANAPPGVRRHEPGEGDAGMFATNTARVKSPGDVSRRRGSRRTMLMFDRAGLRAEQGAARIGRARGTTARREMVAAT